MYRSIDENSRAVIECSRTLAEVFKRYVKRLREIDETIRDSTFHMRDETSRTQFKEIRRIEQALRFQIPNYQRYIDTLYHRGLIGKKYENLAGR